MTKFLAEDERAILLKGGYEIIMKVLPSLDTHAHLNPAHTLMNWQNPVQFSL